MRRGDGQEPDFTRGLMRCSPTSVDLGLPSAGLEDAVQLLGELPFLPTLRALSVMSAAVYHAGYDRERQRVLARHFYTGPVLERVEGFLEEDPDHLVFDARHLAALQRLAVIYAAEGDPPEGLDAASWRLLAGALLALGTALPNTDPPEPVEGERPDLEGWTRYTVQAGLWYDQPYVAEAIARAWARYVDVVPSLADHHSACPVDEWMRADHDGAGLSDQLGAGLAYAVGSGALEPELSLQERSERRPRPGFLANTSLAGSENAVVRALSADRDELRAALAEGGEEAMQVAWDHAAFDAKPFLREPDGTLVLLSPSALVSWLTRGVHYRLLDAGRRRADPGDRSRTLAKRWLDFAGALGEESVRRLLRASLRASARAGSLRLHGEREYWVGNRRHDGPDAAVDAGHDLVLFEAYSGRVSRAARASADPARMRRALEQTVTSKLRELMARARDALDGHLRYPDHMAGAPLRVWPVLVLAGDGVVQTPVLWAWLREELPELDLVDARLRRPVICDLDDLEPLLALVEDGHTLPGLLTRFLSSEMSELPPRNWIAKELQGDLSTRPEYVREQWTAAVRAGAGRVFPDSRRIGQLDWANDEQQHRDRRTSSGDGELL